MSTHPMKLVTIVCEAHARDVVTKLLRDAGARGYTLFAVEGEGLHGKRPGDIPEFTNIQMEVVVSSEVAQTLLTRLEKEFFPRYASIAFESEVRVLRKGRF